MSIICAMPEKITAKDVKKKLTISPTSETILRTYPPITCIANGESVLHEEGHVVRVMLYADMLCNILESKGISVNRHAVLSAIRIHDSYRRTDYDEEESHGLVAAVASEIAGNFTEDPDADYIHFLTTWHSENDKDVSLKGNVTFPIELAVLKDADALDRFRDQYLGVEGEGLDKDFLRLEESNDLVSIAEELNQRYFSNGVQRQPLESVIEIGKEMGIVC